MLPSFWKLTLMEMVLKWQQLTLGSPETKALSLEQVSRAPTAPCVGISSLRCEPSPPPLRYKSSPASFPPSKRPALILPSGFQD